MQIRRNSTSANISFPKVTYNRHCGAVASYMYVLPELCSRGKRTGTPTGAAPTCTEDCSRGTFFSFESLSIVAF